MCRQNSPQWRHFFQGNSPPKKMDQKIVVTIGNHAKWPTFCWIQPELLFRLVFLLVALLPVRENTELPVLVPLMGDALM